jgi:phenylacetate-coenzyme A ligase PaaK-like adenylate-forming protein
MLASYEQLRQQHVAEFRSRLPEHIQRMDWSAGQLRTEREQRLRTLVRTAQERSPWHRERLAGIDPNAIREDDLERLPTMTKKDLMANWDRIVTDPRLSLEMVEEHLEALTGDAYLLDHFHAVASSGSSGQRGVFVYDWEGWLTHGLVGLRGGARLAAKRRHEGPIVIAMVAAEHPTHVSSALAQTFTNPAMTVHRLPVTLPVDEIVARLNKIQATSLAGYPSMLHLLAERSRAGGLQIHPMRVLSSAEPLLPEARRAMEDAWGVPVQNGYAASEAALAVSCEYAGSHIVEDLIYFEPVDSSGQPVPPSITSAKVYLTNLYNLALPLIRYELTDEVTLLSRPCECGSSARRIGDVLGRADDIFTYSGTVKVHPHVFRSPLSRQRAVLAYQVRQTKRGADIDVQLSGDVRLEELGSEVERALRKAGVIDPEVRVAAVETLDRGATGKLKRFVPIASPVHIA